MPIETQICVEHERLLDKVAAAVRAHTEASSRLADCLIKHGDCAEHRQLHDEVMELQKSAEKAWEEYHRHLAAHNCRQN